ncbi:MAG TPA: TonB-dependent receptor [Chitinophagaceae bacterium]|nr:TonB-dependent receptor [Chitinophagaceae bacterium]
MGLVVRIMFCWVSVFLLSISLVAQVSPRISANFSNIRFPQFVQEVENKMDCHFYYNPVEMDSFVVNIRAEQLTLLEILHNALSNSPFTFTIDSINNVFVYNKRYSLQSRLPADFFSQKKEVTPVNDREVDANPKAAAAVGLKSSLENKLFEIGGKTSNQQGKSIITGYVRDVKNGEPITGASVYVDTLSIGVITDQFGYFTISLPKGRHVLQISAAGMKETRRQILLSGDGKLNIELQDNIPTLKAVVVVSEKASNIRRMQMGMEQLNMKTIKKIPVLLGEADVLRAVLTLPGVTSVGEASTGFNVRGGSADQNLILYNDATIYNPSHLFGFFSAFNADVVKSVDLYKSSIPEKYGGRLSSVLDVTPKNGNNKKFSGTGGIGLLTSKLTIEGPIVKDRTSFILGGRTTYSNWLLKQIPGDEFDNSEASFYDADLHLNHIINQKNHLYLTAYISNDRFKLNSDTTYDYGNRNIILKWKHIFSSKFYATFSGGIDKYDYSIEGDPNTIRAFTMDFGINQLNFRADANYAAGNNHSLDFGLTSTRYRLQPGSYQPDGNQSQVLPNQMQEEQALESAIYAGDKITISPKLSVDLGIRYSVFNFLGPHDEYTYIDGLPRETNTVTDTLQYGKNDFIKTWHGPEYRTALRFTISDSASIKLSYNSTRQYIHLLSNTAIITPTDVWKLSDPNIRPQQGEQVSIGFYRNFKSNTIETSVEFYYKRMKYYLDYKSGASLVLNPHIETDVMSTKGRAYGAELLIKKQAGKVNGWISYTYSRTMLKMDDSLAGQQVNNGEYYPANFDKPHNVNFIFNYSFSHRYSVSFNLVYSTGRPITLPIAVFNLAGSQRIYYSERNQYRVPDYFRADLALNIEGNHKIKKLTHNSWSLGVYNLTGRKNPYSIYFIEENGAVKGYKLSVIGTAIPYITYNFRF